MPLYERGDFAQFIYERDRDESITDPEWVPSRVIPLVQDLIDALVHLHTREISHNDIKPENMFVEQQPNRLHLVLGDFSFASVRSAAKRGVQQFQLSMADGMSIEFAPPEMLRVLTGSLPAKQLMEYPIHSRDVYAVGILLWCVIGRLVAWKDLSIDQIAQNVLSGKRPDTQLYKLVSQYQPWLPLLQIAEQCWQDDPQKRPTSVDIGARIRQSYPL